MSSRRDAEAQRVAGFGDVARFPFDRRVPGARSMLVKVRGSNTDNAKYTKSPVGTSSVLLVCSGWFISLGVTQFISGYARQMSS